MVELRKALRVNIDNCTGCQSCVVTCSLIKYGVFSKTRALLSVLKDESKCLGIPMICEHCENPACVKACPENAIEKDYSTGRVTIDPKKCTGCGVCKAICPFGDEIIRLKDNVAVKCDLCNGEPACVKVCHQKALQYIMATKHNLRLKSEWAANRIRAIKNCTGS